LKAWIDLPPPLLFPLLFLLSPIPPWQILGHPHTLSVSHALSGFFFSSSSSAFLFCPPSLITFERQMVGILLRRLLHSSIYSVLPEISGFNVARFLPLPPPFSLSLLLFCLFLFRSSLSLQCPLCVYLPFPGPPPPYLCPMVSPGSPRLRTDGGVGQSCSYVFYPNLTHTCLWLCLRLVRFPPFFPCPFLWNVLYPLATFFLAFSSFHSFCRCTLPLASFPGTISCMSPSVLLPSLPYHPPLPPLFLIAAALRRA